MRLINGELIKNRTIELDQGYSYGMGFFETIHVAKGPILLKEHLNRLNTSLDTFGINKKIEIADVYMAIKKLEVRHEALKIMVSEHNIIYEKRPIPYTQQNYNEGVALMQNPYRRYKEAPLVKHKSLNYYENMLGLKAVRKLGYFDGYILNEEGFVTETNIANLFILKGQQIKTSRLEEGLLPGVVRQWVIENFHVKEGQIDKKDLQSADAVFITNALMGILWVSRIEGQAFENKEQIEKMRRKYEFLVEGTDGTT